MSTAYKTVVEAEVSVVTRDLQLRQAYRTSQTVINDTVIAFELDAIGGPIKDIKVEFWLDADGSATFTPSWTATREGAETTFVTRDIPAIADIVKPANARRYYYEYGDLPEGAQLRFNIAQDNAGAANVAFDAVLTYNKAT